MQRKSSLEHGNYNNETLRKLSSLPSNAALAAPFEPQRENGTSVVGNTTGASDDAKSQGVQKEHFEGPAKQKPMEKACTTKVLFELYE